MITQQDIETLKTAILRTVPPTDKPVAIATMNLALDVLWKLERITVAFEKIAAKG